MLPRSVRTWHGPVLMVLVLVFTVVMLCSSGAVTAAPDFTRGVIGWSTDTGIKALNDPAADRHQKMRALVALHRNARAAIATLERAKVDPAYRDEVVRLLADIEREMAKVEGR